MPKKKSNGLKKGSTILLIFLFVLAVLGGGLYFGLLRQTQKPKKEFHISDKRIIQEGGKIPQNLNSSEVIDFNQLSENEALDEKVRERKAEYGMEKGVDLIVQEDESFKIGESTVSMQEILEKINLKKGNVIETDLTQKPVHLFPQKKVEAFGIHVVRPGDNIWNIHFQFFEDYLENKGVELSPVADEPDRKGYSSGVGKILKFSENMVYIYNLREQAIDIDLDLIHPMNKIVVFHMGEIFSVLDQIDYDNVERIQFDGENLWLPAEG